MLRFFVAKKHVPQEPSHLMDLFRSTFLKHFTRPIQNHLGCLGELFFTLQLSFSGTGGEKESIRKNSDSGETRVSALLPKTCWKEPDRCWMWFYLILVKFNLYSTMWVALRWNYVFQKRPGWKISYKNITWATCKTQCDFQINCNGNVQHQSQITRTEPLLK